MLLQHRSSVCSFDKFVFIFLMVLFLVLGYDTTLLAQKTASWVESKGTEMLSVETKDPGSAKVSTDLVEMRTGKHQEAHQIDTIVTFDPVTFKETVKIVNYDLYMDGETDPEFPGSQQALFAFLAANIKFPQEAAGVAGKVVLMFVIGFDGEVQDVKIAKTSGNTYLDREAFRVTHLMPKWKPGTLKGEPVNVIMSLPVLFQAD
jgi:TonB family protein